MFVFFKSKNSNFFKSLNIRFCLQYLQTRNKFKFLDLNNTVYFGPKRCIIWRRVRAESEMVIEDTKHRRVSHPLSPLSQTFRISKAIVIVIDLSSRLGLDFKFRKTVTRQGIRDLLLLFTEEDYNVTEYILWMTKSFWCRPQLFGFKKRNV